MNTAFNNFLQTKRYVSVLVLILCATLSLSCQKQTQDTKTFQPTPQAQRLNNGPPGFPSPVLNKSYYGTGVIVIINRKEGWVEINHEEIKGLMPAMQMEFWIKDRSLLDKVQVGDRVNFTIVETAKGEYLTELKKAGSVSP